MIIDERGSGEGRKKLVARGATATKGAQLRGNFEKQPSVGCVEPTAWSLAFPPDCFLHLAPEGACEL